MDKDNLSGEKALIEERRKKLEQLRDKGNAYGNSFKPENNAKDLHEKYDEFSKEELVEKKIKDISVAGRIVLKRVMGNASFATLRDSSGDIQIYVTKNNVEESVYEIFKIYIKHLFIFPIFIKKAFLKFSKNFIKSFCKYFHKKAQNKSGLNYIEMVNV